MTPGPRPRTGRTGPVKTLSLAAVPSLLEGQVHLPDNLWASIEEVAVVEAPCGEVRDHPGLKVRA